MRYDGPETGVSDIPYDTIGRESYMLMTSE